MAQHDVVILCGGKGTRLSEETTLRPKPMVQIGSMPILWHIMKSYSHYGCKRFILALGYKSDFIKEYFLNLRLTSSDFKLSLDPDQKPEFFNISEDRDWEIIFVDTGNETLKGGRIKRVEKYIQSDHFHLTYGDGVSDVDISKLVAFHQKHQKYATVTAVRPPSRFGEMVLDQDKVKKFEEKPQMAEGYINGGFFMLNRKVLDRLSDDANCDFEFGPLQNLAEEEQLCAYRHDGFWQCMDNVRERDYLSHLVESNKAPWMKWNQ